jgi:Effector-associated domain 11
MPDNPVFNIIQKALAEGDTGRAINLLTAALESQPKKEGLAETLRTLRVIEANYNVIRQQEIKGLLDVNDSQRQYSRINDALLAVIGDLEAGRKPVLPADLAPRRPNWKMWVAVGALLLILGFFTGRYLLINDVPCPDFANNAPKIMILPFLNLGNPTDTKNFAAGIQGRIQELGIKNNFPLSVKVLTGYDLKEQIPDQREVMPLGQRCNADMVVWGAYETDEKEGSRVKTRFIFPNATGEQRVNTTGFQNFKSISNLAQADQLRSLDDAIFSLCGAMAIVMNNDTLARKWLEKVKVKSAFDQAGLEMLK